jgi:MacB-like periplasmic core domain/FtsX-like permease family
MPAGRESFPVDMDVADERYFQTLGVQLVRGRRFRESDTATAPKVAVVNQQFAQKYWPHSEALGKRFRIDNANRPLVEIVGISKTAKYEWIGEPPTEFVYLPFAQHPRSKMTLLIESQGPPGALAEPVREVAKSVDSRQPVFNVRTIEEFYQKRVVMAPVMIVQAVSAMGFIGLALSLAGLYGLMTYATSRRTREIGIRMAVGADASEVLRLVLRKALILVMSGIAIGLLMAAAAEKGLNAVFVTSGSDLGAYLLVLPLLLCVTMTAAFIPALKASRTEPIRALRYE